MATCFKDRAMPSMIEHTGAYSAIHSSGNRRFHTTANFPFDVAFPFVPPLPPVNQSESASNSSVPGQPSHQAKSSVLQKRSTPLQSRQ
eukprot:1149872-Pelagomonas_calceolata.AAC.2